MPLEEICDGLFVAQDETEALSFIASILSNVLTTPVVQNCHNNNHHIAQNCVLHSLPSKDNSCSFCEGTIINNLIILTDVDR